MSKAASNILKANYQSPFAIPDDAEVIFYPFRFLG